MDEKLVNDKFRKAEGKVENDGKEKINMKGFEMDLENWNILYNFMFNEWRKVRGRVISKRTG